jgi:Spy/CpxP family protein refolding chaperone
MKKSGLIISGLLATSFLGLGSVASAGPCGNFGGGPGGPGGMGYMSGMKAHHRGFGMINMMQQLDLNKEQRQAIRDIVDTQRNQMRDRRDQLVDIRQALHDQVSSDSYDAAKVRELADQRAKIMADMMVQRSETMNKIRKQLTTEQREKLDQARQDKFGFGYF